MRRTIIADLPFYTEGPISDGDGNLFFTTLSGGVIWRFDQQGCLTQWAFSDCPNGQIILPNGDHLVCDSKLAAIRRFSPSGRLLSDELAGYCAGEPVQVPNDLIMADDGTLFFTDSIRHAGRVFYVRANGQQGVLAANLDYPNGLVFSPCGNWLYVAESYRNRIVKIDVGGEGGLEVFADLPVHPSGIPEGNLPDGLSMGEDGNLWIAHYGMQALQVISPEGALVDTVDTGIPLTSNVSWLTKQRLLVTGGFGEPGPGRVILIEM
ncbi:SMP-30/gluconolactonase/LRE family protein [Parapedobacter soli]|uniref:SMP-30/gluconolactonase/LRE family protein n=1 Tax=Parapedobacter soli TaxID=416955 RepID=UPI0021CA569A|nr:SMP-30/gluconolactonase/LRE family protein [Parapedobacter soli]